MFKDVDGEAVAIRVWHGTQNADQATTLLPACEKGGWWQFIDHDSFLNPVFNEDDPDERLERIHQLRTAYANIVYDALLHSEEESLSDLAKHSGLENLGKEVRILFVTENEDYARSYGPAIEINLAAEGLLAAIPDENINRGFGNWLLVFKAGSPFPIKLDHEIDFSPRM
ncbi:hypothetical protein [Rhizobium sp. MHM7A]|uniref:hypothetical protein n=1 Tax=Rhizobium sp. MHM7A TaxID=2583233 RepID=UPI0011074A93|nr:hypothetical protein [Rhizobium sp. MHM7A]TLX16879.1 hypothetical protein FFR93_05905 [Rhizobium sp. MHM7A]